VGGLMERSRHFGVGLVLPCPHSEAALRRSPDPIPVLAAVAVAVVLNCRRPGGPQPWPRFRQGRCAGFRAFASSRARAAPRRSGCCRRCRACRSSASPWLKWRRDGADFVCPWGWTAERIIASRFAHVQAHVYARAFWRARWYHQATCLTRGPLVDGGDAGPDSL
jgi:hypothetical protein